MKKIKKILIMQITIGIIFTSNVYFIFAEEIIPTPDPAMLPVSSSITAPIVTSTLDPIPEPEFTSDPTLNPDPDPQPEADPPLVEDPTLDPDPVPDSTLNPDPNPQLEADPPLVEDPTLDPDPVPDLEESKDNTPPRAIRDLEVKRAGIKSADISWTAPYDDNKVKSYDVRISVKPIKESNWGKAIQISGSPTPQEEGETEVMSLNNLPLNSTIYVAVISYDESGNKSDLSNVVEIITSGDIKKNNLAELGANANSAIESAQEALSPVNGGVVRLILQKAGTDSLVPDELIFVNFINEKTGVSTGGAAMDGLLSMEIPNGTYTVKLLLPPGLVAADTLPIFMIEDGSDVDLGIIRLTQTNKDLSNPKGLAGSLSFIIQLLFEIIKLLKEILLKLG